MRRLRNLSLLIKLVSVIGLVLLLVFSALITVNLTQLKKVSSAKGELEAQNAGKAFAVMLENQLTSVHSTLGALSDTLLEARENRSMSRADIVSRLCN